MLTTVARRLTHSVPNSRFASTLVIADHDNKALAASTLSAVTAASKLGGDVTVLVAGSQVDAVVKAAAAVAGVKRVLKADNAAYAHGSAENLTALAFGLQSAEKFTHIVAPATSTGKSVIPRLAAKLDVAPISEVTKVLSDSKFQRPMYAGNAIATVSSKDSVKLMTVRGTAFEKAATSGGSASVADAAIPAKADLGLTTWVSEEVSKSDRPDLETATTVVSGGRGMKGGENFPLLFKLADKIGAAVGASRAACDAGWVPHDMQVGQTGKVVAPQLYMAFGISGAIQHIAGMKDSKVIAVVNKDAEAPFFEIADYGLVGDLFKVLPEFTEKVQK